jgi:hypothetical protein
MDERHLHHMYQAWCQGQEDPCRDWSYFVEWVSRLSGVSGDRIMQILQTTYWFKRP